MFVGVYNVENYVKKTYVEQFVTIFLVYLNLNTTDWLIKRIKLGCIEQLKRKEIPLKKKYVVYKMM